MGDDEELAHIREKKKEELKALKAVAEWPEGVVVVTDGNFDEFIAKYKNVVVDCWAGWCGPCNRVAPVVEELANAHKGRTAFAKLDVDQNRAVPTKYAVRSIPALLVFKDGKFVDSIVGAMPRQVLEPRILKLLA